MNVVGKIILSSVLALVGSAISSAQTCGGAVSIRHDVEFLSDPVCGGRASGTAGSSEAARYILHRFRSSGLEPTIQTFDCKGVPGRNVLAQIRRPGARQWIVITAYYDGLGVLGGEVYPGADSNASGTAALLSLADSLAGTQRCRFNVMLVALDGHNSDYAGASVLLGRSLSRPGVRMVVDLDIIGSSLSPYKPYQKNYLIALGGLPYRKSLDALGAKHGLTVYYDYYGSPDFTDLFYSRMGDRSVFIRQGIPTVMFTSGITMNTNKVCDTAQTLDYEQTGRRVALILDWLETL